MQVRETGPIVVNGEHCAITKKTARTCRSIQGVARQNQSSLRISSVVICYYGVVIIWAVETVKIGENFAIGIDLEYRAIA
jgi:hypothetical protein